MTADSITLRLAQSADAEKIAFLSRDLIEAGLGWSWNPERVARAIRNRDTVTLLACDRGERIIGFAVMRFGDEHAHLSLLAVRPSYQRRGLGRRLIDWLLASARVAGIATIGLELRSSNHGARRFYRAVGFNEGAYIPGYYRGREMALRMMLELRKVGMPLPPWPVARLPKR